MKEFTDVYREEYDEIVIEKIFEYWNSQADFPHENSIIRTELYMAETFGLRLNIGIPFGTHIGLDKNGRTVLRWILRIEVMDIHITEVLLYRIIPLYLSKTHDFSKEKPIRLTKKQIYMLELGVPVNET